MERIGDAADHHIYLSEAVAVGYAAAGEAWSADEVDIPARQRSWFVRNRWPRGPRIDAAAGPAVAEALAIAAAPARVIDAGSLSLEDELEQSISQHAGNGLRLVEDDRPSVSVVIPTMNEAANLPHVLAEVSSDYELIVVDGGSHDGTMEVARTLRPDAIVMQQPGRGKADALFAGFAVATGDVIVTLDADGSQKACEIESFVDALWAGADFAKGSRIVAGGGSADLTRLRRIGNCVLGKVANTVHGTAYTDLTYGFNAFWRRCLPVVVNASNGFEGETIMCIRAARAGLRITEIACFEERRMFGQSNLRTFRDGWRILWLILNERQARSSA
jgi:hypothetical protein